MQKGIHYYERINVQFDKQVVAVRKGMGGVRQDSTAALQLIREMTVPAEVVSETLTNKVMPERADSMVKSIPVIQKAVKEKEPTKTVTNINNKINTNPLSKKANAKVEEKGKKEAVKPKAVMGKGEK